jgi:hypothetical protein
MRNLVTNSSRLLYLVRQHPPSHGHQGSKGCEGPSSFQVQASRAGVPVHVGLALRLCPVCTGGGALHAFQV